jgi:hypothetical protein
MAMSDAAVASDKLQVGPADQQFRYRGLADYLDFQG